MNSDEIARALYRLPLNEAIRRVKRWNTFRHALFATGQLYDPIEPESPFYLADVLSVLERKYHFRRDAVPEYITLQVGRAAREQYIKGLQEEYALPPAERFKRVSGLAKGFCYDIWDVDTWEDPFSCLIKIPAEINRKGLEFSYFGPRAEMLTNPELRPLFFDPRVTVLHGAEAVKVARETFEEVTK